MIIHGTICYIYKDNSSISFKEIVIDETFNTLWFLKSLFVCYLVYVLIALSNYWIRIILLLGGILIISFISWFHLKLMLPCFFVGILLHKHSIFISKINTLIISGVCFVMCMMYWNASYFVSPSGIVSGVLVGNYQPLIIHFQRFIMALVAGTSGSVFFISLFYKFFSNNNSRFILELSKYGRYTLGIYILQTIVLETILPHYVQITGDPILVNLLIIPLISLAVLIVCVILYGFLTRFRTINNLFFGAYIRPRNS